MKRLSDSSLKTEKTNHIQNILKQQAPGRRKGGKKIFAIQRQTLKWNCHWPLHLSPKASESNTKGTFSLRSSDTEKPPAWVLGSSSQQAGNTCVWMKLYLRLDNRNRFTANRMCTVAPQFFFFSSSSSRDANQPQARLFQIVRDLQCTTKRWRSQSALANIEHDKTIN